MQDISLGHHDAGTKAFIDYYMKDPLRASSAGVHSDRPLLPVAKDTIEQEIQDIKRAMVTLNHSPQKEAYLMKAMLSLQEYQLTKQIQNQPWHATVPLGISMVQEALMPYIENESLESSLRCSILHKRTQELCSIIEQCELILDVPSSTSLAMEQAQIRGIPTLIDTAVSIAEKGEYKSLDAFKKSAETLKHKIILYGDNITVKGSLPFVPMGREETKKRLMLSNMGVTIKDATIIGITYVEGCKRELEEITGTKNWKSIIETKVRETALHSSDEFEKAMSTTTEGFFHDTVVRENYTIPKEEFYRIEKMPWFLINLMPFACVSRGEPFGNRVPIFYYTIPEKVDPQTHNRIEAKSTVYHEMIHTLQDYYSRQAKHPAERLSHIPELREGLALYNEIKLLGEKPDSIEYMHAVKMRLWRGYRVLVDLYLMTGDKSTLESIGHSLPHKSPIANIAEILHEEIGHPLSQARGEALRYANNPTQPMSYLIGLDKILGWHRNKTPGVSDKILNEEIIKSCTFLSWLEKDLEKKGMIQNK